VVDLEVCLRPRTHDVIRIPGVLEVTLMPAYCQASLVSRGRGQGVAPRFKLSCILS